VELPERIDRLPVPEYGKMQMRPGAPAGVAYPSDPLALSHPLICLNDYLAEVGVQRLISPRVLDHHIAPVYRVSPRIDNASGHRSTYRRADRRRPVHPVVERTTPGERIVTIAEAGGQPAANRIDERLPEYDSQLARIHCGAGDEEFLTGRQRIRTEVIGIENVVDLDSILRGHPLKGVTSLHDVPKTITAGNLELGPDLNPAAVADLVEADQRVHPNAVLLSDPCDRLPRTNRVFGERELLKPLDI